MNKQLTPLEAFKELRNNFQWLEEHLANFNIYVENTRLHFKEDLDIIEIALKEYQEIINTGWKNISSNLKMLSNIFDKYLPNSDTLEDLEKALKAFKIIKEKQIEMYRLKDAIEFEFETDEDAVEFYNQDYGEDFCITIEEFRLLKEVLK